MANGVLISAIELALVLMCIVFTALLVLIRGKHETLLVLTREKCAAEKRTERAVVPLRVPINGKPLFVCNPEKNKECKRTRCLYNEHAMERRCNCTVDEGCALRDGDGKPIPAYEIIEKVV